MKETKNYKLNLPQDTDYVDIEDFNSNFNNIDNIVKENNESINGNIKNNDKSIVEIKNKVIELEKKIGSGSSGDSSSGGSGIDESKLNEIKQELGDRNDLKTSNKDNLVSAINEVFQCGNNVKFNTVDALLQVDKSLQINKSDSWNDIIKNIGKISTGKKFARGITMAKESGSNFGMPSKYHFVEINELNFKPSIFLVYYKQNLLLANTNTILNNNSYNQETWLRTSDNKMMFGFFSQWNVTKIYNNGITKLLVESYSSSNDELENAYWIAIE